MDPSPPTLPLGARLDAAGRRRIDIGAVAALAVPLIANGAVQLVLNLTDTWFVGRLSADALAAIAVVQWPSLLLIVLVGFAMLKKPPMGQSWWMIKIGLWFFLGLAPVLAKRKVLPAWLVLVLSLAAAITAAWLGLRKPF